MPHLWELLEQRPEDKVTLPEGLRQALWSCLLQRLTDISVCKVERRVPDRWEELCALLAARHGCRSKTSNSTAQGPACVGKLILTSLLRYAVMQTGEGQGQEEENS